MQIFNRNCLSLQHAVITFPGRALVYSLQESVKNKYAENMTASIRAFCDSENLLEMSTYTGYYVSLQPYATWLSKHLTAREACIRYFKEVKSIDLEKRVYC